MSKYNRFTFSLQFIYISIYNASETEKRNDYLAKLSDNGINHIFKISGGSLYVKRRNHNMCQSV